MLKPKRIVQMAGWLMGGVSCFAILAVLMPISSAGGDKELPTTAGLDFEKVGLVVDAAPSHIDRLYQKAIKKLYQAGMYKSESGPQPGNHIATLKLTLYVKPINEIPNQKVMYAQRLELWEIVTPLRYPEIQTPAVTWSYGPPLPVITDEVGPDRMEADVEQYLFEFIRAYRLGNPKNQMAK